MLAVKTYDQTFIDDCRRLVAERLAAYDALAGAAAKQASGAEAVTAFEPQFLGDLAVVLDRCFVHRTRAIEGKDGNPLNEVRMLASSIVQHGGVLAADTTIRYRPDASVLGIAIGDRITIDRAGFPRLADAFFAELEQRFT